ncbi:hypothetical protein M8C21_011950 [Ambrosia artemisiifolia]|uniref:C2H2-type domain-containing protein n=1 Tax=Ambrosia artemisiifolia TaxID=4212 RepID=A0AAD5D5X9_AMBAR|nr:hypothetical protein M8C21_011950 [Ambrosia artemisiifolia]
MDYPHIDRSWNRSSVTVQPMDDMRAMFHREQEKEIIRENIIIEELERRRILEAEVRRELNLQPLTSYVYRFEHGEPVLYECRRVAMPLTERYHDVSGSETVPLQWRPPSPKIKTVTINRSKSVSNDNEMIGLGYPSGSKHKAAKKEDFSCEVCKICASSARHLNEHLSGKKHLAKVAAMSKIIKKKPTKKKKKKKGKKKRQKPS